MVPHNQLSQRPTTSPSATLLLGAITVARYKFQGLQLVLQYPFYTRVAEIRGRLRTLEFTKSSNF